MKKTIIYILIAAFVFFSLSSCNQSDIGIFYGIENEEKIVDNSLSNSLTIGAMDKLGTTLYIAAGKVYKKTAGSSEEWAKCSSPSGYDLSTSLTVLEDTTIFAVWFNKDSADTALFKSTDGNSWTEVPGPGFTGDLSLVKSAHEDAADGIMVVSTVTDNENNLGNFYTSNDGSTFNIMTGINAPGGHFDIDHDGTDYWFLTKENIYKDVNNDLVPPLTVSLAKIEDDEYFRYIYAHDTSHIYVNRDKGKFSFYSSSWDETIEDLTPLVNDMTVLTVNSTDTFFVGTDRYGYYEPESPGLSISNLNDPESDSITCDYSTYNSSDLKYSAVLGFYDDISSNNEFYALTYGKGLWRNIESNGERKWQRE